MGQKPTKTQINPQSDKENKNKKEEEEETTDESKNNQNHQSDSNAAQPPKPPPRPPRRNSKINIVAGESNIEGGRSFFLEQFIETVVEKKTTKSKKGRATPKPPPKQPPKQPPKPPKKKYTCNGVTPEIIFGSSKDIVTGTKNAGCGIRLPPKEPGIGKKHGWIIFADDDFWYIHNEKERFTCSYINGHKVKDSGLDRTIKDGYSTSIPRSSVRLHDNDIITLGSTKTIKMIFTSDYQSIYWIEYDKFMNGERPKPDREWLKSLGCNVKVLTAKKGALAVVGGFRVKRIKEQHDAEVKLRELEEKALKEKLRKQKEHVLMLKKKVQEDYLKVKDVNLLNHDIMNKRKLKLEELAAIEKKKKEEEIAKKKLEDELKEQQRILREAAEAKRIAEQKSALAKHRLLGSQQKILASNKMNNALEVLREAQAEKLRQEAEEARRIEEARIKEEKRIQKLVMKNKNLFNDAIDTKNYKKLSKCLDSVEIMEEAVKNELNDEINTAKDIFSKVSSELTIGERQELEKARIEAVQKLLIKLQSSETTEDHNLLLKQLDAIAKDEVLATAPLLIDEIKKSKNIIDKRIVKLKKVTSALDDAIAMSEDNITKKLKLVEKAKKELDNHIPKLSPEEMEEYEMKAGKCLRRLQVLEQLRLLIEQLNNRAIAEIKSYRDPGEDILAVMTATFLLIGEEKSNLEDWSQVKVFIGKTGKLGLKRRITQHKMENITKDHADDALNELLLIKDVDAVAKKSKGAAIFYAWNKGILDEWKEEQKAEEEHHARLTSMNGGGGSAKGISL